MFNINFLDHSVTTIIIPIIHTVAFNFDEITVSIAGGGLSSPGGALPALIPSIPKNKEGGGGGG